ncbi:MAG: hypothetical protein GC171_16980 [Terrimonas sp.]|nr:hypothetical protein [Terrimonas sp.]
MLRRIPILVFVMVIIPGWACKTAKTAVAGGKEKNSLSDNKNLSELNAGDPPNSPLLTRLLASHSAFYRDMVLDKDHRIQIMYTQINGSKNGRPGFREHYFNVSDHEYFYPASAVKFPIAVLALQRLRELRVPGLDKNSLMVTGKAYPGQTEVYNDPQSVDGAPSVANYIKKIFLVSDNDAFNRLYEFLGQAYINNTLHAMGFNSVQILHRLSVDMNETENRHTNPVSFYDTAAQLLYEQPPGNSSLQIEKKDIRLEIGYMQGGVLIHEPFDFSAKNRISVRDFSRMIQSVFFPNEVPPRNRFNLSNEDRLFLWKYMSMLPAESTFPDYSFLPEASRYSRSYFWGTVNPDALNAVRVFNKTGGAYGFLTEVAFVVDFKNQVAFMLTATIHCNSNGIYNDDQYDYEQLGYPFLKKLGRIIYGYERTRKRNLAPDLSTFQLNY